MNFNKGIDLIERKKKESPVDKGIQDYSEKLKSILNSGKKEIFKDFFNKYPTFKPSFNIEDFEVSFIDINPDTLKDNLSKIKFLSQIESFLEDLNNLSISFLGASDKDIEFINKFKEFILDKYYSFFEINKRLVSSVDKKCEDKFKLINDHYCGKSAGSPVVGHTKQDFEF